MRRLYGVTAEFGTGGVISIRISDLWESDSKLRTIPSLTASLAQLLIDQLSALRVVGFFPIRSYICYGLQIIVSGLSVWHHVTCLFENCTHDTGEIEV